MSPADLPPAPLAARARLRVALRVPVVGLVILGGFPLVLLGRLLLAGAPRVRARFTAGFFSGWARLVLGLLRVRVETSGQPPRPPFLLVANHLSYLDIPVLASCLPCVFVSKAEVRGWPLLGPICTALGTIYIDRGQRREIPRVMAEIEAAFDRGLGVIFFPEGTSSRGETVAPFKPSLLELPVRLGRPVHHATLGYRTPPGEPPADETVCYWGNVPFARHALGILGLRSVLASVHLDPEPITETDRKLLAERLREAVLASFEPLALQQRAAEDQEGDAEVDDEPGDVDQGGDEGGRGDGRVEA
jgi:1-acyl-sn-glycerol-3-phosphate acyltransferase